MTWKKLRGKFEKVIEEVRNEEFDNVSNLKNEFLAFFGKKKYIKTEFIEAKEFVRILNQEIQTKLDFYGEQMGSRVQEIKNIQVYANNMKIMDLE